MIFGAFILIFCGTFFYLPELRSGSGTRESVYKVYKKMQDAGPDLLIPAPPHADERKDAIRPHAKHFPHQHDEDPHIVEDRYRLKAKVDEDLRNVKVLEKPDMAIEDRASSAGIHVDEKVDVYVAGVKTVPPKGRSHPVVTGGEDSDESIRQKRLKIVEVSRVLQILRASTYCNRL
jgi:mannosyl-oligosaccharide alpha-1,2-mannosidase